MKFYFTFSARLPLPYSFTIKKQVCFKRTLTGEGIHDSTRGKCPLMYNPFKFHTFLLSRYAQVLRKCQKHFTPNHCLQKKKEKNQFVIQVLGILEMVMLGKTEKFNINLSILYH